MPETCLGSGGSRDIIGLNGEVSCEENTPIIAICEATQTSDDRLILNLVASVGDLFAFELRGAAIERDGTLTESSCEVTIIEDELAYGGDLGGCGAEEPSMEQPCQITNVVVSDDAGADLAFDIECQELISGTTGNAFDVGGLGGGPSTIRFARCSGL